MRARGDFLERPNDTCDYRGVWRVELLSDLEDGARNRVIEDALWQHHRKRVAGAGLAARIKRMQADLDRQPSPGVRGHVLDRVTLDQGQTDARRWQLNADRVIAARHALTLAVADDGLHAG